MDLDQFWENLESGQVLWGMEWVIGVAAGGRAWFWAGFGFWIHLAVDLCSDLVGICVGGLT